MVYFTFLDEKSFVMVCYVNDWLVLFFFFNKNEKEKMYKILFWVRMKHVKIDFYFVKERVVYGGIMYVMSPTRD